MDIEILNKIKVTNGYDIIVKFFDDTSGIGKAKRFFYESEKIPTDTELITRIAHIAENVLNDITEIEYTKEHPEIDRLVVEKTLIDKGLLQPGETFEDLKTLEELTNVLAGGK